MVEPETPPRKYVVLKATSDGELVGTPVTWERLGTFEGGNDQAAIREALKDEEDPSGTYLGVPERSWRPRKLTITTVKKSAWA